MHRKNINLLLMTDVYKCGHLNQYVKGTQYVYSYLMARSTKNYNKSVFFGLQYYLKEYLTRGISHENVDEFMKVTKSVIGSNPTDVETESKLRKLANLGYLPIEIKCVPEGTVIDNKNVLLSIKNTLPEFHWVVGFIESVLLKIWFPITVATTSYTYRKIVDNYFEQTCKDLKHLNTFMVHDFGYRGDTSEESSMISGSAHLLSFIGSDTLVTHNFLLEYYNAQSTLDAGKTILSSVPASEHSVMCSFGKENELDAYINMLELYPSGIVSIVSDTYDIYNVLTNIAKKLKPSILKRNGKVVFRPDSGNQEHILCGDPEADPDSPQGKGCLRLLDEEFGSTINSQGYKVLNDKVGLIYGDGMYLSKYERILEKMKQMGYASCNLVIGVGGILRFCTRDTLGFAIKATNVIVNGESKAIYKDPVTDSGKKSHRGLLTLEMKDGCYVTRDEVTEAEESEGLLKTVFLNGKILVDQDLETIRKRVESSIL
jgi:nicotinamide phosphoribosyltransferase